MKQALLEREAHHDDLRGRTHAPPKLERPDLRLEHERRRPFGAI